MTEKRQKNRDLSIGDCNRAAFNERKEDYEMSYDNITFPKESVFLVTGAAGFIGSNLVEAILRLGYQVRGLDNFSTGFKKNVDLFLKDKNYEFIQGDIRNLNTCMKACEGIDYVLHQAAWGSVPRSIELPLLYEEINIRGTLNMLEAARINRVKKFVYASSSSVYGDESTLPKKEGREGNLLSPYALTKRANEEFAKLYTGIYGLDTYGLRYFNVFGKRQDPDGPYAAVIPRFIRQLLREEQPIIHGDGKQSRDFSYIENVIEANLKACKAGREAAGEVYNIAYGGREYLIDIYHELCRVLNKTIDPMFGPERKGDIRHSNADISKAQQQLDYHPEWSFQRGIEEAIEWYKKEL